MRFPDGATQASLRRGDGNQMGVIRHQTIAPDFDLTLRAPLGHEFEIKLEVDALEESLLTTIAALGDVVRHTGNNDACESCHGNQDRQVGAERRELSMVSPN